MSGTQGSSFNSGRSRRVSCIRSARSSRPSISYISSPSAPRPSRRRSSIPADADADTSTRITSPNRRRLQLGLDCFEEIVGVVGHLEVGVASDAEQNLLGDLHPGEERRQEVGDHRFERHEPLARIDESVEALRAP